MKATKTQRSSMHVEDNYTLARLKNTVHSAEGTNLPPRLIGGTRVPIATGLKLARALVFAGGDHIQYTLTWNNPPLSNIDHFNIYVRNSSDPPGIVLSPFFSKNSPALLLVIISPVATSRNIITIQTVLTNGLSSALNESPSVVAPLINFP